MRVMLLHARTMARSLALVSVLSTTIFMEGAAGAHAASEAVNDALFGKPTTVHSSTPRPASATNTQAQHTGRTRTNTAVTRTQAPPTFSTPHIATTTPRPATTTPAGGVSPGTPATGTTQVAPNVPNTGAGTPTTPGTGITAPGTTRAPLGTASPTRARPATLQPAGKQRTSLSTAAIVAAVLAGLLILLCMVWGAARWYAYEPHWTVSLRHSFAEAGLRLSATWEEFGDWARLGR